MAEGCKAQKGSLITYFPHAGICLITWIGTHEYGTAQISTNKLESQKWKSMEKLMSGHDLCTAFQLQADSRPHLCPGHFFGIVHAQKALTKASLHSFLLCSSFRLICVL